MMQKKPYIRVFDPLFTYDRANNVGKWSALRTYLQITEGLTDLSEPGKPCPLQTAYYRYADHIAVLLERDGVFYCQTIVGGVANRQYEVLAQAGELRSFFDECGCNLTVLDNDRAHVLKPDFDSVLSYVQSFADARAISEAHRESMRDYAVKLNELQERFEDLFGKELKSAYTDSVKLAGRYLITLNAFADELGRGKLVHARRCILNDEKNPCRMFGLFVYALLHGIGKGRHLQRHRRVLAGAFSEMIDELRLFMEIHPTIEEDYARYLRLPANERAKLHALLEDEGLFDKEHGYIGGNLF